MNLKDKETENYFRFNSLMINYGRSVFIHLFNFFLSIKSETFEQFLNRNQHDIYHMCYSRCCNYKCRNNAPYDNPSLYSSQLETLFDTHGQQCSSRQRGNKPFCCSLAKRGIKTDVLDITLAYVLLSHFCEDLYFCEDLLWKCCLNAGPSPVTFESFLNQKKHDIFHLHYGNTVPCCFCNAGQISKILKAKISRHDWLSLFNNSSKPCANCALIGSSTNVCSVRATVGIMAGSVAPTLLSTLQRNVCTTRLSLETLKEQRNRLIAHATETNMSCSQFKLDYPKSVRAILWIANICDKSPEMREAIQDLESRPIHDFKIKYDDIVLLLKQVIDYQKLQQENNTLSKGHVVQNDIQHIKSKVATLKKDNLDDEQRDTLTSIESYLDSLQNPYQQERTNFTVPEDLRGCLSLMRSSRCPHDKELASLFGEILSSVEKSWAFQMKTQSVEKSLGFVPDNISRNKMAYITAIDDFRREIRYLLTLGNSGLSEIEFTYVLKRDELRKNVQSVTDFKTFIHDYLETADRTHFHMCLQYIGLLINLCLLMDIQLLCLLCICDATLPRCSSLINGEIETIKDVRRQNKSFLSFLQISCKENQLYYSYWFDINKWEIIRPFMKSFGLLEDTLSDLCDGHFEIISVRFNEAKVYMTMFGSFLRWSKIPQKRCIFKFKQLFESDKTYFNIISVSEPSKYIKMGTLSLFVRGIKGDPNGRDSSVWDIRRIIGTNLYVLCPKNSKENFLCAGYTGRLNGSRKPLSKKCLWIFRSIKVDVNDNQVSSV